jgi:hypothetical protein
LIEPSEALAELSRELSDAAGAKQDVPSPDAHLSTGNLMPSESNGGEAPRPPAVGHSAPPPAEGPVGLPVQQHGNQAQSPSVFTNVIWGRPLSAPRDFRLANRESRNVSDAPNAHAEPSFIGGWADDVGGCRTRKAPLVISSHAAKTANGECDFGVVARQTANRWRVTAICAAYGNFWRANIALKLMEPNLTWSSERGTETYVRCKR